MDIKIPFLNIGIRVKELKTLIIALILVVGAIAALMFAADKSNAAVQENLSTNFTVPSSDPRFGNAVDFTYERNGESLNVKYINPVDKKMYLVIYHVSITEKYDSMPQPQKVFELKTENK